MPRPRKCRKVCCLPKNTEFNPSIDCQQYVILTVDEYETIRLIDKEGFSQEECAKYMEVARTTIQLVYNQARHKIASALVDGYGIRIEGGTYVLCDGQEKYCRCGGCQKHRQMIIDSKKVEERK